ncbi:hypothetical protein [Haloarchaeobius sp. HME9146]|uniref:hypothetical protein n=1 Tax=Haloarchaeobius sp. HME9146 TaxID=2978732 RepID=UPI0021BE86DF|nr:hypothetical protein [Haloarchaeobius sp. HME9146]MCT9096645.1 hypothetical protein [Haloarchaeobius sp. HME9146]
MSDDPADSKDSPDREFEPDPEKVRFLREIADEIRAESTESDQLANILYRTSDLYDENEDTSPEEILRNVKFILDVIERGGLGR